MFEGDMNHVYMDGQCRFARMSIGRTYHILMDDIVSSLECPSDVHITFIWMKIVGVLEYTLDIHWFTCSCVLNIHWILVCYLRYGTIWYIISISTWWESFPDCCLLVLHLPDKFSGNYTAVEIVKRKIWFISKIKLSESFLKDAMQENTLFYATLNCNMCLLYRILLIIFREIHCLYFYQIIADLLCRFSVVFTFVSRFLYEYFVLVLVHCMMPFNHIPRPEAYLFYLRFDMIF